MTESEMLRCARTIIVREQRQKSRRACGVMPFDPYDADDVDAWLRHSVTTSKSNRYNHGPRLTMRNLVFDARQEGRKARRRQYRVHGKNVAVLGIEALEQAAARPDPASEGADFIEQFAASAAVAGHQIVFRATKARSRKAEAVLTCFGRLAAMIGEQIGAAAASTFLDLLTNDPKVLGFPLTGSSRERFREAALHISQQGNLRRDLTDAKLPWPAASLWREFVGTLAVCGGTPFRSTDN